MPSSQLVNRYAQAVFSLAVEQGLEGRVTEELDGLSRLLRDNRELRECLLNPFIRADRKQAVITDLFAALFHPLTLNFLRLAIEKRRERILPQVAERMNELLRNSRGILPVRLTSARPLTPAQEAALRDRLSRIFSREVEMKTAVDAALLGGIVIQAESRQMDGSCRGQLEKLRYELSKN